MKDDGRVTNQGMMQPERRCIILFPSDSPWIENVNNQQMILHINTFLIMIINVQKNITYSYIQAGFTC